MFTGLIADMLSVIPTLLLVIIFRKSKTFDSRTRKLKKAFINDGIIERIDITDKEQSIRNKPKIIVLTLRYKIVAYIFSFWCIGFSIFLIFIKGIIKKNYLNFL